MDVVHILMWLGYAVFAIVAMFLLGSKCWTPCRKRWGGGTFRGLEVIPSSTTASNSFTYIPSPKSNYLVPSGTSDGLSEFDDSILFDQPMLLSCPSPFCRQKADPSPVSEDNRGKFISTDESSHPTLIVEDDQQSVHCVMNSFSNSILSINSCDGYDKDFCEEPTVLVEDNETSLDDNVYTSKMRFPLYYNSVLFGCENECDTNEDNPGYRILNTHHSDGNHRPLQNPFLSHFVSDVL